MTVRIFFVFVFLTILGVTAKADTNAVDLQRWQELNQETIAAYNAGNLQAAEAAARIVLEFSVERLQDSPRELSESHNNHGVLLQELNRLQEGRAAYVRALEIRRAMQPIDLELVANSHSSLAYADIELKNNRAAAAGYRKAIEHYDAAGLDAFSAVRGLALSIDRLSDASEEESDEALDATMRAIFSYHGERRAEHPDLFAYDGRMAMHLASVTGRLAELLPFADALVQLRSAETPVDALALGTAQGYLARTHAAAKDFSAAERAFDQAATTLSGVADGINVEMGEIAYFHGDMLKTQGRYAEAVRAWLRSLEVERQIHGDAHEKTIATYERLGNLLIYDGRPKTPMEKKGSALTCRQG